MNLNGKYILLKNKKIKKTLQYLYDIGYNFPSGDNDFVTKLLCRKFDSVYVHIYEYRKRKLLQYIPLKNSNNDYIIFDLEKNLREAKLKRILK